MANRARKQGETFEAYRESLKKEAKREKLSRKGTLFWESSRLGTFVWEDFKKFAEQYAKGQ